MSTKPTDQPKEKKGRFMTIRIPSEIDKELRQRADENTRTLAAQVLHYIKQGMANEKTAQV
jgi:hypothetical protein